MIRHIMPFRRTDAGEDQNYCGEEIGEDISEYESIWGYSIGETEPRSPLYDYSGYDYEVTGEYSHLSI